MTEDQQHATIVRETRASASFRRSGWTTFSRRWLL
jgi:hypothetical protein